MSHVDESCHSWMSHVTYGWFMSHKSESCHIWMGLVTYGWVMSHKYESCHIWMSHVTYGWVTSHKYESCHIWMSHVTYEWVMAQVRQEALQPRSLSLSRALPDTEFSLCISKCNRPGKEGFCNGLSRLETTRHGFRRLQTAWDEFGFRRLKMAEKG